MPEVFTIRGWRTLARMYVPDLIQASRELPRADRDAIVRRASEIYSAARRLAAAAKDREDLA